MAKTKEQKKNIVEKLTTIFKDAGSVVFVTFRGLSVSDTTEMRKSMKNENIGYTVLKKTLAHLALKSTSFKGEKPEFPGELAVVYGEDDIAPARAVYEFQKKHKGAVSIVGGVFEGSYIDAQKMTDIAQIPGMETLRGQFVNLIYSPVQRIAVVLNEIAKVKE